MGTAESEIAAMLRSEMHYSDDVLGTQNNVNVLVPGETYFDIS